MIRFDIPYVDTDRTLTQAGYEVLKGQERRIDALDLGQAPFPKDAAGLGNWDRQYVAPSGTFTLPAGGTLAWCYFRRTTAGNGINAIDAGVSAGGTNILTLGAGEDLSALIWRLA